MTGAALEFNAERHEYRRPDGRLVPSVTRILRAVGLSTDFDALAASGRISRVLLERARNLGHRVHATTQAYDDGDVNLSHVADDVLPFLEAWAMCRQNLGLHPIARERRLYHEALDFCGTLDGVFYRDADPEHLILVDLKTGAIDAARYQTAAYALLWRTEYPHATIAARLAVALTPHLPIPYRVFNFTSAIDSWRDEQVFRGCLLAYRERVRCA